MRSSSHRPSGRGVDRTTATAIRGSGPAVRAQEVAGSVARASSPSRAAPVHRQCTTPGSRCRPPRARRDPRAQGGAPSSVVLDLGSRGRDVVGRRVREIAQHLPADGRIAVEQPVDHAHRRTTSCGAQGPPNADTRPRSHRTRSNAPTESAGRAAARLRHDVRFAAVAWSCSLSGDLDEIFSGTRRCLV
jgi:hypothetical protein